MKGYATLKDVAKLAGTTAATVSYVLNGSEERYVSPDMKQRVLEAAKQLNYVKSSVASSLKGKKRKMIAVLVPQFSNQFFTRMILEIEKVADAFDYILSICNTFDNPEREKEILDRMAQHRVDGYIIAATIKGATNTERIRNLGIPLVALDRPLEGDAADYIWVTTNNYQCGYLGAEYLAQKGHSKIAFVGWDSQISDLLIREQGFLDAIEAQHPDTGEALIVRGEFSEQDGYRLTKELLENNQGISAIFYGYNIQARGGVQYLTEQGIVIGKDISVILIGSPEWAVSGQNNFTHILQHEYSMGRTAASILFDIINGQDDGAPRSIVQACSLYEGNSVKSILNKKQK